jgi:hypothetical protein
MLLALTLALTALGCASEKPAKSAPDKAVAHQLQRAALKPRPRQASELDPDALRQRLENPRRYASHARYAAQLFRDRVYLSFGRHGASGDARLARAARSAARHLDRAAGFAGSKTQAAIQLAPLAKRVRRMARNLANGTATRVEVGAINSAFAALTQLSAASRATLGKPIRTSRNQPRSSRLRKPRCSELAPCRYTPPKRQRDRQDRKSARLRGLALMVHVALDKRSACSRVPTRFRGKIPICRKATETARPSPAAKPTARPVRTP